MTNEEMVYYLEHADITVGQKCKTKTAEAIEKALKLIKSQPKRGAWVRIGCWGRSYKCNQCGNSLDFNGVNVGQGDANFCPNCGADMRGDNSDGRNHAIYIIDNHLKEVKTDGR